LFEFSNTESRKLKTIARITEYRIITVTPPLSKASAKYPVFAFAVFLETRKVENIAYGDFIPNILPKSVSTKCNLGLMEKKSKWSNEIRAGREESLTGTMEINISEWANSNKKHEMTMRPVSKALHLLRYCLVLKQNL